MQTSKKQLIQELMDLVDRWNDNGGYDIENGNSQYGNALQNCADELLSYLMCHADDVRELA